MRKWPGERDARSLMAVVVGLTLLGALPGCGPRPPASAVERPLLVLWHPFTGPEALAIQTLSDRFSAENPWGLQLIAEYQRGIADKLAAASPEQRPDLIVIWPEEAPAYAQTGLAMPLTALPTAVAQAREDLLPMAEALYTVDGELVAFPLGLATYLLYANADWLGDLGYEAPPATWAALQQAACAAGEQSESRQGIAVPWQAGSFLAFWAAGGAPLVDAAGGYQLLDSAGTQTLEALRALFSQSCGQRYEAAAAGVTQLGESRLPLVVESSLVLPAMERAVAAGRNFVLRVGALPGPQGPGPLLWYGPGVMVIAPAGPRREATLQALGWLLAQEAQLDWYRATAYLPVRASLVELLRQQSTAVPEQTLFTLTLEAAATGRWVAWPRQGDAAACRAALVRAFWELEKTASLPALQQYMQAVCTGVLPP